MHPVLLLLLLLLLLLMMMMMMMRLSGLLLPNALAFQTAVASRLTFEMHPWHINASYALKMTHWHMTSDLAKNAPATPY